MSGSQVYSSAGAGENEAYGPLAPVQGTPGGTCKMCLWDDGRPSKGKVACLQHSPWILCDVVGACLGCWAGSRAGRRWRDKGNVGLRPRRPVESFECVPSFCVLQ